MNPFKILELESRFDLDLDAAEHRHRELSRALHPDRFVGRPASERRLALSRAIEVNEAWRTLRDPVRRAEALLNLHGIDSGETSSAKADPELLMEMMEQREALAETRASKDLPRLRDLSATMRDRQARVLDALTKAFSHDPQTALPVLAELRYVRRFLEEASALEDELL
ncbi:MAG TPA: Fe-S protein assembly co-chaperone HscB [Polyangiaceae bacterium]|nr:Fe-S protein assembly co-chaperone HscB [Polyangiaceae bacterium]